MNRIKTTTGMVALTLMAAGSASAWDLKVTDDKAISFHGFASQGFLASTENDYLGDTQDGSFQFTELGLNAAFSPFNRTRIAVQGFAFDVGNVGNFEPLLDYASIEYIFNDKIGIRGGRVRKQAGIYNHIQDLDLGRTSVLLPQGIYDSRWRDFSTSVDGGQLFGNIPLGKAGSLSYEIFGGAVHLSDEGGIANLLENSLKGPLNGAPDGFDTFTEVGAQLWWNTPVQGLRAGVNVTEAFGFAYDYHINPGMYIPARSESDSFATQLSVEYLWKNWTFQAEYYYLGLDTSDTLRGDTTTERDSWYVSAAYRFNNWLEVGSYYTEFYANQSHRGGAPENYQKDVALSFRFDVKDWWILKLEGHYIRGAALLNDGATGHTDDGWFMLAAKTTFSF